MIVSHSSPEMSRMNGNKENGLNGIHENGSGFAEKENNGFPAIIKNGVGSPSGMRKASLNSALKVRNNNYPKVNLCFKFQQIWLINIKSLQVNGSKSSPLLGKKKIVPEQIPEEEAQDNFETLDTKTDILPWNIIEDPPFGPNKKELYPIEGSWRLVANQNFDKYLASVGVTPLMAQMVLR